MQDSKDRSKSMHVRRGRLGGRESLPLFSDTPTKTGVLSTTRMMSASWRFRVLSSAPASLLLFSDLANAMTLEMTLAPNASRVPLIDNVPGPLRVDEILR
jgi:hypothetical protein